MADRNEQSVRAHPFAKAALELTADEPHADAVEGDLASLAELAAGNADFALLIDTPLLAGDAKFASLQRILAGQANELTMRLLRALAAHEALPLLRDLAGAFREERDRRAGRVAVEATTAFPLEEPRRAALATKLAGVFGGPVVLTAQVDPKVIGGLVLRVGDTLFDGSVRQRLEQMRQQVIARGYHEIQGSRDRLAD